MISINVKNLSVRIKGKDILKDVSLTLAERASLGIVGASGSGKTMFAKSLMGLLPTGSESSGEYDIEFFTENACKDGGKNCKNLDRTVKFSQKEKSWREIRGHLIGMVLQDPFTALEPLKKCGKQIIAGVPKDSRASFDIAKSLEEVGLPKSVANRYPYELSGGMRQRVVIAAALATEPKVLIADEATSALDVVIQKEILDLIDSLRRKRGMPLLFIAHDMSLVAKRTDRIAVFMDGELIEEGPTKEIIDAPKNEYTKRLIQAASRLTLSEYQTSDSDKNEIVLSTSGISKTFDPKMVVSDASIFVGRGECVGIVGESGSGKTTLARIIVGLTKADKGVVDYKGRGYPGIVFQDPYSSLNPAHSIRHSLEEALLVAKRPKSDISELLALSELGEDILDKRPARLSGGQRQRVAIARTLALEPELLVCDESVSALDILVQEQILQTLDKLRKEKGLAILFITHDLSVVKMIASRLYVMSESRIIESGTVEAIFSNPKSEFTKNLLEAAEV